MIAVLGEALIDLVVSADGGAVSARPGGGPFNTARTVGRLGQPAAYFGRLSDDAFGRMLRAGLDESGVTLGLPEPTTAPTTLATVSIGPSGGAEYRFYLDGTSAADMTFQELASALRASGPARAEAEPDGLFAVHAGTLALFMEPVGASIEKLITTALPERTLVMIDPNCRSAAIPDRAAYLARLSRLLRRADIVKVSTEDLEYIAPCMPAQQAAAALLGTALPGSGGRAGPALVLVTDGPRPAYAILPGQQITAEAPAVRVVDTIGAGDAFGGAFLAWWSARALTRADLSEPGAVRLALAAAAEVASLTCARRGADPPRLAQTRSFQAG